MTITATTARLSRKRIGEIDESNADWIIASVRDGKRGTAKFARSTEPT
jgi:hypothetical protein